jgi:hypothetical protein
MSYSIEKHKSEWVVYAHGAAVLRCAEMSMALEIIQVALECLAQPKPRFPPAVRAHDSPPLAPEDEAPAGPDASLYP